MQGADGGVHPSSVGDSSANLDFADLGIGTPFTVTQPGVIVPLGRQLPGDAMAQPAQSVLLHVCGTAVEASFLANALDGAEIPHWEMDAAPGALGAVMMGGSAIEIYVPESHADAAQQVLAALNAASVAPAAPDSNQTSSTAAAPRPGRVPFASPAGWALLLLAGLGNVGWLSVGPTPAPAVDADGCVKDYWPGTRTPSAVWCQPRQDGTWGLSMSFDRAGNRRSEQRDSQGAFTQLMFDRKGKPEARYLDDNNDGWFERAEMFAADGTVLCTEDQPNAAGRFLQWVCTRNGWRQAYQDLDGDGIYERVQYFNPSGALDHTDVDKDGTGWTRLP